MIRRGAMCAGVLSLCLVLVVSHIAAHGMTSASDRETSARSNVVLRVAMPDASPTVDPALVADEQGVQVANLLYSGLVQLNASYHVVPNDATWTVSRNHMTYTFHLKHGLRFANGDPVTAQDFAYSITRSLNPALPSTAASTYLLDIKGAAAVLSGKSTKVSGIDVLDRNTLRITARWPVPYFLMELTYPTSFALDQRVISKYGAIDNTSWYANPVGSGPYALQSWTPNVGMVFQRNKYYAGPKPHIQEIDVSLSPINSPNAYVYLSKHVNIASMCSVDPRTEDKPGVKDIGMLTIDGVYMGLTNKLFRDRRVRLALTLALNRPELVGRSMPTGATPFSGFVPIGQLGYDPSLRVMVHNSARARYELWLAGYRGTKKLPSLTLYYAEDPCGLSTARLASAIASQWHKALGISVDTQALKANALLAKIETNSLPLYLAGWSADYPDPHDWLSQLWKTGAVNNNVRYHSVRFDTLVRTADVTWNASRRLRLYDGAQQVLVDDAAWIPIYIPHRLVYVSPGVQNLSVTGFGILPATGNWASVSIAPKVHTFRRATQ